MEKFALRSPEFFNISGGGLNYQGAMQGWYLNDWQRKAGCGPTAAANLCAYFAQTSKELRPLCPWDSRNKKGMTTLMEAVWRYVTPGRLGLNSTARFNDGLREYAKAQGLTAETFRLDIPPIWQKRPSFADLKGFMQDAFLADRPIAFLNLSSGKVPHLDSWHWVTLIALDGDVATMLDEGNAWPINLRRWLNTSKLGGGLSTAHIIG